MLKLFVLVPSMARMLWAFDSVCCKNIKKTITKALWEIE